MVVPRPIVTDVELSVRPRTRVEEQRRVSRKALTLAAQIVLPDGQTLEGQTADISREGIGFFCPRHVAAGLDCTLIISIDACGTSAQLKLVGRVCHCTKQADDHFRIGMKFIRMDETTATILCAALR
jgi:c-di-GMP-binding flagellar brake protein YcgR